VTHNGIMTTPESRTRRCRACGHWFRPDGDEVFCSGICAGTPSAYSLLAAAQQLVSLVARGQ
jgi:hypothetical protein